MFGVLPDELTETYVAEVKCSTKEKTVLNYVQGGVIKPKFKAQLQLQMLFTKKKKALFCTADLDFENTKYKFTKKSTMKSCVNLLWMQRKRFDVKQFIQY